MQRAQQIIDSLVMKAPIDGVVSLKENRDAPGGMSSSGMVLPEYRAGRFGVAGPAGGRRHRVRARWKCAPRSTRAIAPTSPPGSRPSVVRRRAAGRDVHREGRRAVGPRQPRATSSRRASVTRQFDVTFQFDKPDPRLKAGSSARVDDRRQGDARRAPRAAAGGVREERQELRLRQGRRPLRAARGQGRAAHREPRRDRRAATKAPRSRSSIPTARASAAAVDSARRRCRRPAGRE